METFRVFNHQQHNSITEYYLDDALGSVRQLTSSSGEVVLARSYDPYGNLVENTAYDGVTTAYGYTGEYTDYYIKLIYLRSRYYSPTTGRFLTKDSWQGDYTKPLSLNGWNYVVGNPINRVDPSGYYGEYVHYTETKRWGEQILKERCPNCVQQQGYLLSDWISEGDNHVDAWGLDAIHHIELHFKTNLKAWNDVRRMEDNGDPYLFGAALHGLQDYWSHTYEGYPPHYPGHVIDSALAGCGPNGCERPQNEVFALLLALWIEGEIESPTHEALKNVLNINSSDLSGLTTSDLFDVWLREQPGAMNTRKAANWKNMYGYATDDYYAFTIRDKLMEYDTKQALTEYFDKLNSNDPSDLCLFNGNTYTPPSDDVLIDNLNGTN